MRYVLGVVAVLLAVVTLLVLLGGPEPGWRPQDRTVIVTVGG